LGNHGRSMTFLQNWPESDAVSLSGGRYAMVSYPGQSGASTASYPTAYYAFDVGRARIYVLDADWTDSNVGTSTLYGQDHLNHWSPGAAEYEWLKADLAAHPGGLKFATFHFPLHSDNATETSDTYLQGPNSLEGLLASNGVALAFNGHSHMYQRNAPVLGRMVSYVTGGGGGVLEPTGGLGCTAVDSFSIGWSPTSNVGSRCGSATTPTSPSQVYHFLHVTVSGSTVTVAPRNALGQTFDVVTYDFPSTSPAVTTTLTPSADTFVYQGAPAATSGTTSPLLSSAGSYRSLLRFDTSAISPAAAVTGVSLRVYSTVGLSSGGVQVHPQNDAWDESTTTWSNQPAWDTSVAATSTTPTSPGWLTIPLPPTIISAGGRTSLGLGYSVPQMVERIASREDPGFPPRLVVTTAAAPVTTRVSPTADTYVYQGSPAQAYGSTTPLLASAGSYRGMLRFDTSWIPPGATVSAVTLRLFATVGLSSGGIQVRPQGAAWSEPGTTWANQPGWSSQVLATSTTQSAPGWISIALPTSAVTSGGNTDVGLSYSVTQMIERVASREDPNNAPQLVVTTS
ncbi:MAG: metallophosphoesterase, partial [Frankiales bacterium]|nr:metallophosphoesterase [Frankiales bacterium]